MSALEMRGVRVAFSGRPVLDGVDLEVPEGGVFGFIGRNGAGKTTTMKVALGLLRPDAGEARVLGERVRFGDSRTNREVGYLPDVPEFYGHMTAERYLALCGEVAGMGRAETRSRAAELLDLVGLASARGRVSGFSRGMRQRLGIAQALLSRPRLVICDEPTSALDPVGRREVLDLLAEIGRGATVLFSTHVLSDVERVCDRVAILHGGRVAMAGALADLRGARGGNRVRVEVAGAADLDALLARPELVPFAAGAERDGLSCTLRAADGRALMGACLEALRAAGVCPVSVGAVEPTLEDLFCEEEI